MKGVQQYSYYWSDGTTNNNNALQPAHVQKEASFPIPVQVGVHLCHFFHQLLAQKNPNQMKMPFAACLSGEDGSETTIAQHGRLEAYCHIIAQSYHRLHYSFMRHAISSEPSLDTRTASIIIIMVYSSENEYHNLHTSPFDLFASLRSFFAKYATQLKVSNLYT